MPNNKLEKPKPESIRFYMDSNGRCFPISADSGDLYHYGCLSKETFSKDMSSGKNLFEWNKYSEKVEEVCKKIAISVFRTTGSRPSHALVIIATPSGAKDPNIFKMKTTKHVNSWNLGTFGIIPIMVGKTKSLERMYVGGDAVHYAGFYKYGHGWLDIPCRECLRYVYCMEKGIATFGTYALSDCPWFSIDEAVPYKKTAGDAEANIKMKELDRAAVDDYAKEAIELDNADTQG